MAEDYRALDKDQLIARLQIADSAMRLQKEENINLHRMIATLREHGWATPRPVNMQVNIRDYPMGGGDVDRRDLAKKLAEANERADHWRKRYMDLLDQTGRPR